jgi:N-acyl-L-homoserine lactone synthetase
VKAIYIERRRAMIAENKVVLGKVDSSIRIEEGGYVVKTIVEEDDLVKAYRLRHSVFAEELRWVPEASNELEIDEYDAHAVHFGVFDAQERLVAYVRLLTADHPFMLEREFRCVLGQDRSIRKNADTAELTRFCVDATARAQMIVTEMGVFGVFMLLFKGVYDWCLQQGIGIIYGVTEKVIHKLLTIKGYPYRMIGMPKHMPDGVVALAVILDWREFERINKVKRPELLRWFGHKSMSLFSRAMAIA